MHPLGSYTNSASEKFISQFELLGHLTYSVSYDLNIVLGTQQPSGIPQMKFPQDNHSQR